MVRKTKSWFFVDCEAVGTSPVAGQLTEFGVVHYPTRETFHGIVCTRDGKTRINSDRHVAAALAEWLHSFNRGRAVFISDNPAYDWQWISAMFAESGIENPFGYSARRISDFYAGLRGDWHDTQTWKRWRKTKHDHNPVHDAMGNLEAFEEILKLIG